MRHVLLVAAMAGSVALALATPPMPQPLAYHDLADQRAWLGVPNALDVLSNLPFAVVGALGLAVVLRAGARETTFAHAWERWPYAVLFAAVALTSAGSSYYHLAPDNARLVWDRLPMAVGFMALLAAVIAERIGVPVARRIFVPLLLLGAASVVHWHWSEGQGAGDLRPYLLVQFGSMLVVLLLLVLYPSIYTGGRYLGAGLALYGVAKGVELADREILAIGGILSGHTLKHLLAAAGVACLVAMLLARTTVRGRYGPARGAMPHAPLSGSHARHH